jgi:hypothetical protein
MIKNKDKTTSIKDSIKSGAKITLEIEVIDENCYEKCYKKLRKILLKPELNEDFKKLTGGKLSKLSVSFTNDLKNSKKG